jgi:hypothetical protein
VLCDRDGTLTEDVPYNSDAGGVVPRPGLAEVPVSKQPLFKVAAVAVTKIADGRGVPSPAPTVGAPAPLAAPDTGTARVPATAGGTAAEAPSVMEG